jgi:phosphoserine phosphatase
LTDAPLFDNPRYISVEFPVALEKKHGWTRNQLQDVVKEMIQRIKEDLAIKKFPMGTHARVHHFSPRSQADLDAAVEVFYPLPQDAAFWSTAGHLDTVASGTFEGLVQTLGEPGGSSNVCRRKIEFVKGTNGSVVAQHWALVCDGACSSPKTACTWVQTASVVEVPTLR